MLRMTILKATFISFSFVLPLSSFPVLIFWLCFISYLLNIILLEENSPMIYAF